MPGRMNSLDDKLKSSLESQLNESVFSNSGCGQSGNDVGKIEIAKNIKGYNVS